MFQKRHDMTISTEERDNMPEPQNLLEGMKTILEFAEESALSDTYFDNVKIPMAYLCRRLNLTPTQVTLLAVIMELNCQTRVGLGRISHYLDISNLEMLSKSADLTALTSKRFVFEVKTGREISYTVSQEVYDAFRHNEVFKYTLPVLRNDEDLANELDKMLSELGDQQRGRDIQIFDMDLRELLHANGHIRLARTLLSAFRKTSPNEFRVVLLMSLLWIRDVENEIDKHQLNYVFDRPFEASQLVNQLLSGRSVLVKKGIVETASSEGLMSNGVFSLTAKFRKSLNRRVHRSQERSRHPCRLPRPGVPGGQRQGALPAHPQRDRVQRGTLQGLGQGLLPGAERRAFRTRFRRGGPRPHGQFLHLLRPARQRG